MGKRNNSQRKENVESPRKEISENEACNMTEKEFRVMVMEFIHRMDEKINNLCKNQEEMKSDIATIKNTMESFNSRLQEAEDRISELEDQVQKQAQAEQQLEKKIKKQEESLRELRDNMKRSNMRIIGLPEGQEEQQGLENLFEEIMTENFPDMGKIKVTQNGYHQQINKRQVLARMRRKRNPRALLVGLQTGAATVENSYGEDQCNQMEALESIYPDSFTASSENALSVTIIVPSEAGENDEITQMIINFTYSEKYLEEAPVYEIFSQGNLEDNTVSGILKLLALQAEENFGNNELELEDGEDDPDYNRTDPESDLTNNGLSPSKERCDCYAICDYAERAESCLRHQAVRPFGSPAHSWLLRGLRESGTGDITSMRLTLGRH
ncbi:hypothetical protein QTO34_014000 [Cnephaeus nilssonii]|uniref:RWD domain-containing protein n=1 Tax=Cnephaeus nilssonii TaxID=3371016 RepID=A0AA40I905_CNENI|nr:hypothetical protein QTO34_014000 [Eptesicus nilssonii]